MIANASAGELLEMIWEYIADCFWDIPVEFNSLFDFVFDHDICIYILVCFLISAAVILLKRIFSIMTR